LQQRYDKPFDAVTQCHRCKWYSAEFWVTLVFIGNTYEYAKALIVDDETTAIKNFIAVDKSYLPPLINKLKTTDPRRVVPA
jgi:hypothetical protein